MTSASVALVALEQPQHQDTAPLVVEKPTGSKIKLTKNKDSLEILIPPFGYHPAVLLFSFFALFWNSFIAFWTINALSAPFFPINLFFALFSLPFWSAGIWMAHAVLFSIFGYIRLHLNQEQIALTWELFGFKYHHPRPAPRQDISKLVYTPRSFRTRSNGQQVEVTAQVMIWAVTQQYKLGGFGGGIKADSEVEWLAHELSDWLRLPIIRG